MKNNAIVCNRYRLYKASGNYDGKGEEIYTAMRATAVTKYMTKHNIPVDLDTNAYFIECCHSDRVLKRVSTSKRKCPTIVLTTVSCCIFGVPWMPDTAMTTKMDSAMLLLT